MRDGMYKVVISGRGVKILMIGTLSNGRLLGCDPTHHVTGTVRETGSRFRGRLTMRRHAKPDGFVEIANLDEINVSFEGIGGTSFGEFDSRIEGHPELKVRAAFQWLCDF
jgi:hypothetical protein